jgi:hypothetical protein
MTDLNEIRQKISLFALAEAAGAMFEGHGTRSHCPLPGHSGDRSSRSFVIYDNGRRWKCHSSCPSDASSGDLFTFYMAWKGVDFKTALKELTDWIGNPLPASFAPVSPHLAGPPPQSVTWRNRAAEFVAYAEKQLNQNVLDYLRRERGLSLETVQAFRLGYNPTPLYDDPVLWGLAGKKVWLPRGIVIPGFWKAEVNYIKIRRPLPGDLLENYIGNWIPKDGDPDMKFGGPRSGRSVLFRLEFKDFLPTLVLTEGEWDAMLLWEHCADLCDIGTIGGAGAKFDLLDLALLTRYRRVLVVHDDDKAGDKGRGYITSLQALAPRITSIQSPAHDLTDYWKAGGDLRGWVENYLKKARPEATSTNK